MASLAEVEKTEIRDLSLSYIFDTTDCTPRLWVSKKPSYFGFYGLSSWFYSLAGLLLLLAYPYSRLQTTFHEYEGYFWILQGYLSWQNDVHLWGKRSVYNVLDRLHATAFTIVFVFNMILIDGMIYLRYEMLELLCCAVALPIGLYCRRRAVEAVSTLNYDAFVRWHAWWHVAFPAGRVVLIAFLVL